MDAQSIKNCAHIIRTPAAMSWSGEIASDVNASPTAAKNEPIATAHSGSLYEIFLSIVLSNKGGWVRLDTWGAHPSSKDVRGVSILEVPI